MGNINDNSSGTPRAGFTPGEWRAEIARNSLGDTFDGYWLVNAPSERGVVGVADCFGEIRGVSDEDGDAHIADAEIKANAALIAAAPAMDLMLRLIAAGRARFEQSTTCDLLEFCFDGMRYPVNDGDWNGVMNVIGWDRACAAIAKANEQSGQFIPHAPRK